MTDYFTLVSVLFPVGSAANVAPALAIYQQFATELEEKGECIGFHAKADDPPGGADLWLHADESADSGVSHHAGDEGKEGIDYNRDLDHVAVAEREP